VSVASKLQIKPGQTVCVISRPQDVALDLGQEPEAVDDPSEIAIDDAWSALRLRPA
jgi:hypothetical protein